MQKLVLKNIKAAIFDLDGTLFDSMWFWDGIAAKYLRQKGAVPSPNVREEVRRLSLLQCAEYFKNVYGIKDSIDDIKCGINAFMEDFYSNNVLLKPGAKEFLCTLNDKGIRMSIATATSRYLIEPALKRTGISDFFEVIFTCDEVTGKDRPDIFERCMEHMGTTQAETAVFEDALHAVKTAKDAGFFVVSVYDKSESHRYDEITKIADANIMSFEETETVYD